MYIGRTPEPLSDSLMAVPHRKASSDKPPISPVGAPQTALDFVRLSGLRSFAPDGLNATPVLWMEHDHPSISMKLFGGNAGKLLVSATGVRAYSTCICRPQQVWDGFGQRSKASLAF